MKNAVTLAEWPKGSCNVIRLTFGTFMGQARLDIREWYPKGGKYHPGTKGISIDAARLPRIGKAVKKARALVKKTGA